MGSILDDIIEKTRYDLSKRKKKVSQKDFESFSGFEKNKRSMRDALNGPGISVIAEIKKGSPSKGIIRHDFSPKEIAEQYMEGGASAISVLTDEPFFMGSLEYLEAVSDICPLPVLRKDFLIDPYQIKEASAYGADAVLLIATICEGKQLSELLAATKEFGMQALVECYYKEEVEALNWKEIEILGVNNRDLSTFTVDLHRGIELLNIAPEGVVKVSESGLKTAADLAILHKNGIDAALIGEQFMKQDDPGESLKRMKSELMELIEREEKIG